MYRISVPKTSDKFNKTFKGYNLTKVELVKNLEKHFKRTGLSEDELLKLLQADDDIVIDVEKVEKADKKKPKETNKYGKPLITKDGLTDAELETSKENGRIKD